MKKFIIIAIAAMAILAACKKDSDSAIPQTSSNFMFFNGVPNTTFGVLIDTVNISTGVAYGQSTTYRSFKAQAYNLYIYDVSKPNVLINFGQVNLRNGKHISTYLGIDTTNEVPNGLRMTLAEDDLSNVSGGQARYRVVDMSDTYKTNRNNKSALAMDFKVDTSRYVWGFRAMQFTAFSDFKTIQGDSTYHLNVNWVDSTKRLGTFPMNLQKGKVYTYVATGNALDSLNFKVFVVQHN
ncbi:protein of unknown function [Chitinophaga jiangningensis]|uniref:DUF4397 domain-containing protein n=1 Tax=Chitinophaga jiangningensis TaxID=1419482 RepID=A0A1M7FYZ7_9BACT|nr:DUF4397 domain-containing protein [Chitinophaga jiangningensis]SHM08907.1 protein of unknown function [Chitinophaga jiangningensis]